MIEFTIKTLDSNNHTISVDDDTTVYGLKQKVQERLGIEIDQQRLIFCGRVLHDCKKIADYGVDGKVVHLVERPPPRASRQPANEDESSADMARRAYELPFSVVNENERPASPTGARMESLQRSIEDIKGLIETLRGSDMWVPPPDSRRNTPEFERLDGIGIFDPLMPGIFNRQVRRRTKKARSAQTRFTSTPGPSQVRHTAVGSSQTGFVTDLSMPGPSHAGMSIPEPSTIDLSMPGPSHIDLSQPGPSHAGMSLPGPSMVDLSQPGPSHAGLSLPGPSNIDLSQPGPSHAGLSLPGTSHLDLSQPGPSHAGLSLPGLSQTGPLQSRPIPISPTDSPINDASSDSGLNIGASAATIFTDRLGRVFEPKPNVPRTQMFAELLTELMDLEEQFNEFRRMYIEWIRSTPNYVGTNNVVGDEDTVRRKQQFSNLMSELHHCFAHAYHVISDLNFQVTPTSSRITSEPIIPSPIQVQVLTSDGQQAFLAQHQPQQTAAQQEQAAQAQMPPPPQPQPQPQPHPQRTSRDTNMPPPSAPPPSQPQQPQPQTQPPTLPQTQPQPQPQRQPQPQTPRPQFQPSAEIIMQQVAPGVQAPVMLGTPAAALNINMQPNPVTFQLEIETRSLEAALLNTVSQFVASQVAGAVAANNAAANNQHNQTAPSGGNPPTGTRTQITSPILGLNLGTTVHLGTFNLGTVSATGGMDVDNQSPPQGTNMETDGQGTNQSATNNTNQENQTPNAQATRQLMFDFENLFRGLTQAHGLGEMEIVMSLDGSGQEESTGTANASASNNNQQVPPGVFSAYLPTANQNQRQRRAGVRSRLRTPPMPFIQGIYDRFLVCNSALARRQIIRRRQADETARQVQEQRALHERAKREDRESRDAPQNQAGMHALTRILRRPSSFSEAMAVTLIVSIHEATTPEVYMILTEAEMEGLRRVMLTGIRHVSFICMKRGFLVSPTSVANVTVRLFQEFLESLSVITCIRPNVNEFASVRAVFNMYMPALLAMFQREPSASFASSYRQLLANFFFDVACLIVHICRDGFRGFRQIFDHFVDDLVQSVESEENRDLMRMLSTSLVSRVADHIETNPSNPHQFVIRTDGQLPCICFDEAERIRITQLYQNSEEEGGCDDYSSSHVYTPFSSTTFSQRSSRAVSRQSEMEPTHREQEPIPYPADSIHSAMRFANRSIIDESMMTSILVGVCESITTEPSVLWDEDYVEIKNMMRNYVGQFTRGKIRILGQTEEVTRGIIAHHSYFARRIKAMSKLRHFMDIPQSIHAVLFHYLDDMLDIVLTDKSEGFIKNFRGILSEMACVLMSLLSTLTYDGLFGLKMLYKEYINELMTNIETVELREPLMAVANYNLSQIIYSIQTRPVEFQHFIVPQDRPIPSTSAPQPSTSRASVPGDAERSVNRPMGAKRSISETMERSSFVAVERPSSVATDRPAISVKRLSSLTGEPPTSTLTVETPSLLTAEEIAAAASRLQAVSNQTSVTVSRPDMLLQPSNFDNRTARAEKRSSSRASSSEASPSSSRSTSSKSKGKHSSHHSARPKHSSSEPMTPASSEITSSTTEETPMAGLERLQRFRSPYFSYRRPMEPQTPPQACYGCLNPSLTEEQPYDPTAPIPLFFFNPALTQRHRGYRSTPTATITSGSLNAQEGSSSASPNLVTDSPDRSPPRVSTSSPVNKRMKQEAIDADEAASSEDLSQASTNKTKSDKKSKSENKRKFPSNRGNDRDPNQDENQEEDSSESNRQSRVEDYIESQWAPIVESDSRIDPEPQPPFSDAYLCGMSARRRRRVRQSRPPQEAGAFMHDCLSTASERAIEGGDAERSVFQAFYDSFSGLIAARVNGSEDYRPMLHAAVHKLVNGSASQDERSDTPEKQSGTNDTDNNI